jgi:hypothetical protein
MKLDRTVLLLSLLLTPTTLTLNAEDWTTYGLSGTEDKTGDQWTAQFKVRYDAQPYYSDEYATHYECIDDLTTTFQGKTYTRQDPWEFNVDPKGAVGFSEAPIDGASLYLGFLPVDPGTDSLESARDLDSPTKWSLKRWAMDVYDGAWDEFRNFTSFAGEVGKVWIVDQWKNGQHTNGNGYSDGTIKDGYPPGSDM